MFSLHVDTARTWRGGQNQVLLTVNGLRAIGHRAALVAHPDGGLRRRAAAPSPSERYSASERGPGLSPGRMKAEGLELVPLAPLTEMDFTAAVRFGHVV